MAALDATDVQLASQANVLASGAVLTDFDEDERIAPLYRTHVDALLSISPWRFTVHSRALTRLADAPAAKWAHAFQLPADRLDMPYAVYEGVGARYPTDDFEVFEDQLRSDAPEVVITYPRRPSAPEKWGPLFRDFVKTSLAAELALSLYNDRSRYETLKVHAWGSLNPREPAGLFLMALQRHSASLPAMRINAGGGDLLIAHMGEHGW